MAIITRETDYAVRALARLAREGDWLAVSQIAEQEDVPEHFLRKIMQRLNEAGMVASRQGPFGGYRLAVPSEGITVLEILEAIQGPLVMNACFEDPDICDRVEFCPVRKRLAELQIELNARLSELSLTSIFEDIPAAQGLER